MPEKTAAQNAKPSFALSFAGFAEVTIRLPASRPSATAVCTMPNLSPVPDSVENLRLEQDIIDRDAVIAVYPYASITKSELGEELSDMEELRSRAVAFSDDGKGVQSEDMMRRAMEKAASLGKIIAAHCEVNELLRGGYIHDGRYAAEHGHAGICSESEWREIERDVRLAGETNCAFHVCHISCRESVEIIRKAKRDGVNVTCETAPHYLVLCEDDLMEDGRFKMNPPLRSADDRAALIEGIKDGTIDMIATDHAPHSKEEKSKGLKGSAMGITGLETAFPVLYSRLVKTGVISLERLIELMAVNPRKRFGIPIGDDYTVWDLDAEYEIDPAEFISMGRATPFEGMKVSGRCIRTVYGGKTVYEYKG